MEQTIAMIKPDGVRKGLIGRVIARIEDSGITIRSMKMVKLTLQQAEEFYVVHKDSKHFKGLTEFTASGPVVMMLLEGENVIQRWRDLLGATDSSKASLGTIRGAYGNFNVIRENIAHGSDSPESAAIEREFYYKRMPCDKW